MWTIKLFEGGEDYWTKVADHAEVEGVLFVVYDNESIVVDSNEDRYPTNASILMII